MLNILLCWFAEGFSAEGSLCRKCLRRNAWLNTKCIDYKRWEKQNRCSALSCIWKLNCNAQAGNHQSTSWKQSGDQNKSPQWTLLTLSRCTSVAPEYMRTSSTPAQSTWCHPKFPVCKQRAVVPFLFLPLSPATCIILHTQNAFPSTTV